MFDASMNNSAAIVMPEITEIGLASFETNIGVPEIGSSPFADIRVPEIGSSPFADVSVTTAPNPFEDNRITVDMPTEDGEKRPSELALAIAFVTGGVIGGTVSFIFFDPRKS